MEGVEELEKREQWNLNWRRGSVSLSNLLPFFVLSGVGTKERCSCNLSSGT